MKRQVNDPKNSLVRSLLDQRIEKVAHYAWGDLLDVGCGRKPYEKYFNPYVTRYVGMDVYDPRYEKHRETGGIKVDVYGSAECLPFKDGEFSTIVSFQVLEHLPHPWYFFDEVARVLSPKGILVLSTNQQWHEHDVPNDYFRFTRYGLISLSTEAGLSVCSMCNVGGGMLMAGTAINYWLTDKYWRTGLHRCVRGALLRLTNALISVAERVAPWPENTSHWVMVARKEAVNLKRD